VNRNRPLKNLLRLALLACLPVSLVFIPKKPPANAAESLLPEQSIAIYEYARGIPEPTDIAFTGVPGDDRLFITARNGWVYLVHAQGETAPEVVLDIDDKVIKAWYEQGLLGIVFDPDFATNGALYLYYTFFADVGDPHRGDRI
jgi:glucose/arabinose dehydrogenase